MGGNFRELEVALSNARARHSGLLADRAAGKNVSDYAIATADMTVSRIRRQIEELELLSSDASYDDDELPVTDMDITLISGQVASLLSAALDSPANRSGDKYDVWSSKFAKEVTLLVSGSGLQEDYSALKNVLAEVVKRVFKDTAYRSIDNQGIAQRVKTVLEHAGHGEVAPSPSHVATSNTLGPKKISEIVYYSNDENGRPYDYIPFGAMVADMMAAWILRCIDMKDKEPVELWEHWVQKLDSDLCDKYLLLIVDPENSPILPFVESGGDPEYVKDMLRTHPLILKNERALATVNRLFPSEVS